MRKLAINGFGRIGRTLAKINEEKKYFQLVAVNDIDPYKDNMVYLLKYDSTYGKYNGEVEAVEGANQFKLNGNTVEYICERNIEKIDWKSLGVDVIIDSSGPEQNVLGAKKLTQEQDLKVVVTHSSPNVDKEIIMGVNESEIESADRVFSNSICDANAIAHVLKWIDEEFGIISGSATTLHPWLSYQNLVDGPAISQANPGVVWKDYALGRASVDSLIPKNTTAITACEKVLPHLKGKFMSFSFRIPTDIVSSSDLVIRPEKMPDLETLTEFLEEKIKNSPFVRGNYESLVSLDYEKEECSAVIDFQWLKAQNDMIKIVLWYDNEWGYSARALDLARHIAK